MRRVVQRVPQITPLSEEAAWARDFYAYFLKYYYLTESFSTVHSDFYTVKYKK